MSTFLPTDFNESLPFGIAISRNAVKDVFCMDTFVPPCPLISMISSTGILQLTSYADSLKIYSPISKLAQPVKFDIVSEVESSTPAKTNSNVTTGSAATARTAVPSFGSGQPPVPSKAPSTFRGFVTGAGGGATTTTATATTAVPAFGSGQPPVPSKAPSTFGGFVTGAGGGATTTITTAITAVPSFGSGQPPVPSKAPSTFSGFVTGAGGGATTTITTATTAVPSFGSGQPPIPSKAPSTFGGFVTGAGGGAAAATITTAITAVPAFGSGQPPISSKAPSTFDSSESTPSTTERAILTRNKSSSTSAIPVMSSSGRSLQQSGVFGNEDTASKAAVNSSSSHAIVRSGGVHSSSSALVNDYQVALSENQSHINDFHRKYSRNLSDDFKTASAIILTIEKDMSQLEAICESSKELIMKDLPLLLSRIKRIVDTGNVDVSHLADGSGYVASLDALSFNMQPKTLFNRLTSVQQLLAQAKVIIKSGRENSIFPQRVTSSERSELRFLPSTDSRVLSSHPTNVLDGMTKNLSESMLAFQNVLNEQHRAVLDITNNLEIKSYQNTGKVYYSPQKDQLLNYDYSSTQKNNVSMRMRKDVRNGRRRRWNELVAEIQYQHLHTSSSSKSVINYDDKLNERSLSDLAVRNEDLYKIGRETAINRELQDTINETTRVPVTGASSIGGQRPITSKVLSVLDETPPVSDAPPRIIGKGYSANELSIPSKAPSVSLFGAPSTAATTTGLGSGSGSMTSSSAGQPPIPSKAPSASLFGAPPAAPTTAATTTGLGSGSGSMTCSSAGQPPIPSKAPSASLFGAPTTTAATTGLGSGSGSMTSSSAGQPPIPSKAPSASLFGAPTTTTTTTTTGLGSGSMTSSSAGQPPIPSKAPSASLLGAPSTAATTTGLGLGSGSMTSSSGGQPPIPSKAPSASLFGAPTTTATTGLGSGSMTSSSAGQPPIPSRAPSASLFGAPTTTTTTKTTTESATTAVPSFGSGQPPIPSKAPSTIGGFVTGAAATTAPVVLGFGALSFDGSLGTPGTVSGSSGTSSSSTSQPFTPLKAPVVSLFGGSSMSTPTAGLFGKPPSLSTSGVSPISFAPSPSSSFSTTPSNAPTPFGTFSSSFSSLRPSISTPHFAPASKGAQSSLSNASHEGNLKENSAMLPQFGQQSSIGLGKTPVMGFNQTTNIPQFGQSSTIGLQQSNSSFGSSTGVTPSRANQGAGLFGPSPGIFGSSAAGNEPGSVRGTTSFGGLGSTPTFGSAGSAGSSTFGMKSPDTGAKSSFSGTSFMTFRST